MTIGHEFVGVVDSVGDHVKGSRVGIWLWARAHHLWPLPKLFGGSAASLPKPQGVGVTVPAHGRNSLRSAGQLLARRPVDSAGCAFRFDPLGNAVHTASRLIWSAKTIITGAGQSAHTIRLAKEQGASVLITDDPHRSTRAQNGRICMDVRAEGDGRDAEARHERRL
jgi:D-arabinose 1-dehydrogenase-like Zn-dependent alcohol dehydrogenase